MVTATTALAAGLLLAAACAQLTAATPAITDLFSWGLDYLDTEAKSGESEADPEGVRAAGRECVCEGPACTCCVNFNISYVDLGGPGCVKLKYLSQSEGLMVNVSYGDSVLHSQQVKVSKTEPACMEMLSGIAGVCARFTELAEEGQGLRGCALLEPMLLGYAQARYPVGCFKMGPDGMAVDRDREPVVSSEEESQEEEESSEGGPEGENEEGGSTDKPELGDETALLTLVNEAAEQGLSMFTSLLGIGVGSGGGSKNSSAPQASPTPVQTPQPAPQRARSLNAIPAK